MRRKRNPRINKEAEEPGPSTPMASPAPAFAPQNLTPRTPVTRSSKNRFKPSLLTEPGSSSTPRNPTPFTVTPFSKPKNVLLIDWWLILAERAHDKKTLAVAGVVASQSRHEVGGSASELLLSPSQKAERVFYSAPIIKRYDTFTLGTADGITVRIQGVINKSLSHHNGFPLEVCDYFMIGFPYNWDDYADEYSGKDSTSATVPVSASGNDKLSKGFADAEVCVFPYHLDEFSVSEIRAGLILTHDAPMDELLTSKFTMFLEKFCSCTPMNPTKQIPSDVQNCHLSIVKSCLPEETSSKYERDKSNEKNKSNTELATVFTHDAEGHSAAHVEVQCQRNALIADGVVGESSINITDNLQPNLSHDSLLHVKAISSENISEAEKDIYLAKSVPVAMNNVNHVPNCIRQANVESTRNLADVVSKSIPNYVLPKELNPAHPKYGKELGNHVLRSNCAEWLRGCDVCVSKDSLVRKVSDTRVEINASLETSFNTNVAKSSKASNKKEKGYRTRSRSALKNEVKLSSSFALSQDVDIYHNIEGQPGNFNDLKSPDIGFSGVSKDSSSIGMNDLHPEILEKIENCNFYAVKDPTVQIGSDIVMRCSRTSKMGVGLLKEPLIEPLGDKGGDRLMKLNNIQKDRRHAESVNREVFMQSAAASACKFVGDGMNQSLENITGKSPWVATDEMFATENGDRHMNRGNVSSSVVRKLHYNTRSQQRNSHSILRKSECLPGKKKKSECLDRNLNSSNGGTEIVGKIPTTDATTSICRMLKIKNKRQGIQTIRSSVDVENNKVRSDPIDDNFVSVGNDSKHKHRKKCARYLGTVGVIKDTPESRADNQASMNGGHESESFKCFVECSAGNATQHDISLEVHPSKDKKLDDGKKIRKERNKRDVNQDEVVVRVEPKKEKAPHNSSRTVWRPSYTYVNQSPLTRDMAKKLSIASPESLNLRRSRSGRLLVPPVATWCQKIIYTADGEIIGITTADEVNYPNAGCHAEPSRKKKKLL